MFAAKKKETLYQRILKRHFDKRKKGGECSTRTCPPPLTDTYKYVTIEISIDVVDQVNGISRETLKGTLMPNKFRSPIFSAL